MQEEQGAQPALQVMGAYCCQGPSLKGKKDTLGHGPRGKTGRMLLACQGIFPGMQCPGNAPPPPPAPITYHELYSQGGRARYCSRQGAHPTRPWPWQTTANLDIESTPQRNAWPQEPPRAKTKERHCKILQVNVTSLEGFVSQGRTNRSREKMDWLLQQEQAQIVLIQEHHLRGARLFQAIKKLRKRYNVFSHPACRHIEGTRGGS